MSGFPEAPFPRRSEAGSASVPAVAELDLIFRSLGELKDQPGCADLLQYRSLVTAHQYRRLVDLVLTHLPLNGPVLDWGCGNGHFSYILERLGHAVHGFSFEDFGLRGHLSQEYGFSLGSEAEPARLPFEDGGFGGVVSVGVLEHVRETGGTEAASLVEIQRVLRPGGIFICYHLPNRYSWIEGINRIVPGQHFHRYRYTLASIGRMCREASLDLVLVERYGVLPRNRWARTPAAFRDSAFVARAWDRMDDLLRIPFSVVCQNYAFVARKPSG